MEDSISFSLPQWKKWITSSLKALQLISVLVFMLRAAWIILVEIPATRKLQRLSFTVSRRNSNKLPIKTLIVLGSGGHTAEMLLLTKHLDPAHYNITYVKAATDTTSRQRLVGDVGANDNAKDNSGNTIIMHDIPRSREVGQSYRSSIWTTLRAQWYCLWLVINIQPDLILCNGPGTCLPICMAALFFRILAFHQSSIVFCESYCRVETLSLTGKLLYPIADLFVVHWPELHQKYPAKTVLVSTFVADAAAEDKQHQNKGGTLKADGDDKKIS